MLSGSPQQVLTAKYSGRLSQQQKYLQPLEEQRLTPIPLHTVLYTLLLQAGIRQA